jgi:hypothetical protein
MPETDFWADGSTQKKALDSMGYEKPYPQHSSADRNAIKKLFVWKK